MSNTEKAREILIRRYSKLSNVSFEKAKSKFDNTPIDELIEKHEKKLIFSVVLIVLVMIALIAQFISLYLSKSITLALITNVLLLIIFQKGLHDNYEIKEILKTLKIISKP